ncbi:MAG: type IX secretion system protein PorQ [Sphingobacteriales bacterium]|nr:type IX secretion system protein PorQ [Sphingobacteriales bacterium]
MRKNTIYLILFVFLLPVENLKAQIGGKGVFRFLNLPNSSKVAALGNAIPMNNQPEFSESFQNPSLLQNKDAGLLALNYSNYVSDINFGAIQYGFKLQKTGVISAGLMFVNYGKFEETDAAGNTTGNTFTAGDYLLNIGYSQNWKNKIFYGANFKLIFGAYDIYKSTALAADFAVTYKDSVSNFSTGLVFKNVGYQIQPFDQLRENLPFEIDFALAQKLKHAPLRYHITYQNLQNFDLTYQDPNNPDAQLDLVTGQPIATSHRFIDKFSRHLVLGAEILLSPAFSLQTAYNFQRSKELKVNGAGGRSGFSFGFSLNLKKISIGYANANLNAAGSNNFFSIQIKPSIFNHKK